MQDPADASAVREHVPTVREQKIEFLKAALLVCLLIALGILQPAFSRERGPRVDVSCLSAPIPVNLHEHQVLVYELHVTNFDTAPLTLKRLEVFAGSDVQPVKSISSDALSASVWEVGSPMGTKASLAIGPGKRAVVFLWIEMPVGAPTPVRLRHRIVFAGGAAREQAASDPVESTLDDFVIEVKKQAVPLLTPPFEGGIWLAGEGPGNDSSHRRTIVAIDGHIYSPERFAIDWVKVGSNGDSHHDGTARNENWWGYGEPVHAVADGEVTQVRDDIEENTPRVLPKQVTLDTIAGNFVTMRIAADRFVTYSHLQPRSITVHPHQHVTPGTVIGRLGNSGQATAPHLHFQVTDRDSVLQSEGVPFMFFQFQYLGPGSEFELGKHPSTHWIESIPSNDAVIKFDSLKTR